MRQTPPSPAAAMVMDTDGVNARQRCWKGVRSNAREQGPLLAARKKGDNMKKIVISAVAAGSLLGVILPVSAASAASVPVGNYAIADLGQGAWAGGPMYADHTLGGGGAFSFLNGQEILRITGGTWSGTASSGVTVCATVTPIKDPLGLASQPLCIGPLPVNSGPQKIEGTLVKISLR